MSDITNFTSQPIPPKETKPVASETCKRIVFSPTNEQPFVELQQKPTPSLPDPYP